MDNGTGFTSMEQGQAFTRCLNTDSGRQSNVYFWLMHSYSFITAFTFVTDTRHISIYTKRLKLQ